MIYVVCKTLASRAFGPTYSHPPRINETRRHDAPRIRLRNMWGKCGGRHSPAKLDAMRNDKLSHDGMDWDWPAGMACVGSSCVCHGHGATWCFAGVGDNASTYYGCSHKLLPRKVTPSFTARLQCYSGLMQGVQPPAAPREPRPAARLNRYIRPHLSAFALGASCWLAAWLWA